jgi:hypothetical protein
MSEEEKTKDWNEVGKVKLYTQRDLLINKENIPAKYRGKYIAKKFHGAVIDDITPAYDHTRYYPDERNMGPGAEREWGYPVDPNDHHKGNYSEISTACFEATDTTIVEVSKPNWRDAYPVHFSGMKIKRTIPDNYYIECFLSHKFPTVVECRYNVRYNQYYCRHEILSRPPLTIKDGTFYEYIFTSLDNKAQKLMEEKGYRKKGELGLGIRQPFDKDKIDSGNK